MDEAPQIHSRILVLAREMAKTLFGPKRHHNNSEVSSEFCIYIFHARMVIITGQLSPSSSPANPREYLPKSEGRTLPQNACCICA